MTHRPALASRRLCVLLLICAAASAEEPPRLDGTTPEERGAALVKYVATCKPKPNEETYPKAAAPAYAARLVLNVDTAYALEKLDAAVSTCIKKAARGDGKPIGPDAPAATLDPFDKVALVNTCFLAKEKIPKPTALKIRDYAALYAHKVWRGYGAMNYRLMMDGAGFLAAEEWPEMVDADGLNAEQIRQATRQRLFGYFDEICRRNYSEYGSPIYAAVNLSAVRMLAEYARNPEMARRAALVLDAMLVDIACSWNQGYNVGTAARAKYWGSTDTSVEAMGSTAAAAWVWFGAPRSIAPGGTGWIHSFWMATPGKYRLPEMVAAVAQERSAPSVYRGTIPAMKDEKVHRTTYHSRSYSLCSQWDHPSSPTSGMYKEARRHMLKWLSPKGSTTFAVCMDNPRRPYNLKENVANALGYGENPFSQYFQHEGTLLGVYAVPEDYPYYKMYVPFSRSGAIVQRIEESGWIFCHNGSMLMGLYSARPGTWAKQPWSGNDMLWVDARKNAWVLETAELAPYAGGGVDAELRRFATAVLGRTKVEASMEPGAPKIRFTNLAGRSIELAWLAHKAAYSDQCRIDGKTVNFNSWPMHQSPWVKQERDSAILRLTHGGRELVYDFEKWTRQEKP